MCFWIFRDWGSTIRFGRGPCKKNIFSEFCPRDRIASAWLYFDYINTRLGGRLEGRQFVRRADRKPECCRSHLLLALCLSLSFADDLNRLITSHASWLITALLLVGIILTASGSAWIGAAVCLVFLFVLRVITARMFFAILAIISGTVVFIVNVLDEPSLHVQHTAQKFVVLMDAMQPFGKAVDHMGALDKDLKSLGPTEALRESARYYSVAPRIATNREAIRMWLEEPVFGKGLGYFMESQKNRKVFSEHPLQIHNTLLWLLAELGLVGFGVFVCFMICAIVSLIKMSIAIRDGPITDAAAMATSLLVFCIGWQIMSLFNELVFQRHAWFALGIAVSRIQLSNS